MEVDVTGEVWWWRGPAPFPFVTVPPDAADAIGTAAAEGRGAEGVGLGDVVELRLRLAV